MHDIIIKHLNITKNMKYLIGNWKANKTTHEAKLWIKKVRPQRAHFSKNLKVILCPSYIHLPLFKNEFPELTLGCQDLSPYGDGAYTGQVTARMLESLVEFTILGHSERYRYFEETFALVALKATQALEFRITPIIALNKDNWLKQANALKQPTIKKSIIMYEPPEAISQQVGPIGRGEAAPLEEVKEMIKRIKQEINASTVIYGGSVKSRNIKDFLKEPLIDGVLPGSASLNADEWLKMISIANSLASR